ncbi:putative NUDIX hydrolase [Actinoplanes missouriensis 431]|uniref:NAD(+) diphosphatase n=1 Tax=Actinoplanes missouriensis (strain ATCC 14538 / DSM 43046 / CBS 188.64 / JCM 3121 / NBRC 102363 / NCIMB 12654 / NRRL B-3342 / UNCC 431) TaxID=512565 RepID=I0HHS0_ACTM4|nr:NAD(+) diphosphatase [Actinoplanes missouriensis]BAL92557.1 putative NUDIX hydrolase [Actinoplanes missouriensis 431]
MTEPEQPDLGEQPGTPPLARTTLDRAAHRRKDDAWLAEAWTRGQVLVVDLDKGGRALVTDRPDGGAALILVPSSEAPEAERWFLGEDADGTPLWTVDAPVTASEGRRASTLREIGHLLDDRDAGLFTAAAALGNWHRSHAFSPRTGRPTTAVEAGWARADADGQLMWPRTDPAMIVLVHDGVAGPSGRCLLGHNASWPTGPDGVRRFSCLAGYVEPGESAEAAVVREVQEEVGITLSSLRYAGSQSWPYPGSLMLGFHAVADPGQVLRLDPEEIDEAHWFSRDAIAKMIAGGYVDPESGVPMSLPMRSSIAFYLVEKWLQG